MSEHTYRAVAGFLALGGALLLLGSPAVGAHAASQVTATAAAGAISGLAQPGRLEMVRVVGGLLLGSGLLGFVRAGGVAGRPEAEAGGVTGRARTGAASGLSRGAQLPAVGE